MALTTALLSSALLGASVTGTLSAFTATITGDRNTATTGSLVMRATESDGGVACLSSSGPDNRYAGCSTIDAYGGTERPLTPGVARSTSIVIANTGAIPVAAFTLEPGACTSSGGSGPGDLCDALLLTVRCAPADGRAASTTLVDREDLTSFARDGRIAVHTRAAACVPGTDGAAPVRFTFSVELPEPQDNTMLDRRVAQPLTWTFTGA